MRGTAAVPPVRLRRAVLPCLVWTALAGCAVGPDFRAPQVPPPAQFAGAPAPAPACATADPPVNPALWWRALDDPELSSLVDRALLANPDLEIALTRLQEARTFEIAVTGSALPEIDASSGGGRGTGSDLTRGGRAEGPLQSADHTLPNQRITSVSGGALNWDIDLFGNFRREIEASRDDAQAAAAARDAVQVAVIADVVRAYVDLRALQTQYAVLEQNASAARKLLDLVQARFDRGITNELDLTLAQRQSGAVEASLGPLAAQVRAAQYAIAVLLGAFPEDMQKELGPPGLIPAIPGRVAAGIPLDLIRRRPDIRAAEWELAGATARIGIATARLFPQLSISAGLGVQGQGFGYQPAGTQRIWSVGYSAVLPLLDFGTLDSLVRIADLQTHEKLVNYKRTVQAAVAQVDTSLAEFQAQQQSVTSLAKAVVASQRAMELASQRYDRGLSDFLNVVDAQRQAYELEGQFVVAEKSVAEQYVALYRSLGGGWESYGGPPELPMPQPAIVAMFRQLMHPGTADTQASQSR
jgi:NodT family efflux transporter outer membrane factor (OMF) lipoprotein